MNLQDTKSEYNNIKNASFVEYNNVIITLYVDI